MKNEISQMKGMTGEALAKALIRLIPNQSPQSGQPSYQTPQLPNGLPAPAHPGYLQTAQMIAIAAMPHTKTKPPQIDFSNSQTAQSVEVIATLGISSVFSARRIGGSHSTDFHSNGFTYVDGNGNHIMICFDLKTCSGQKQSSKPGKLSKKYFEVVTYMPGGTDQVTQSGGAAHAYRVAIIMGVMDTTGNFGSTLDSSSGHVVLNNKDGVFTLAGYAHTMKDPIEYRPVKAKKNLKIVIPHDVAVPKNNNRFQEQQVLVNGVQVTQHEYEVQQGEFIPADLIVYADRGDLQNAGYDVKENGIPICHSHLGLKKGTGVAGMIADPAKLGQMMHLVAQNHLLNKNHFKHNQYVQEVTDKQMKEAVAEQTKNATTQTEYMKASAQLGEGTTVSPQARALCHQADHKRYSVLKRKHSERAEELSKSDMPHERALGDGIKKALSTLDDCHHDGGVGAPGFQVSDFNKNGAITRALNAYVNSNLAPPPHHQQAGQVQANASLQNPYTFASQEFLRHRLFEDFESTLARRKATSKTGPIAKMKALTDFPKIDSSTRTMVSSLRRLNVAAVGSTLHQITPKDYDRHVEMVDLHEKALAILNSTHSANGTLGTSKKKARIDRAKVKVAYYLLKALANDAHTEIPSKRKKRDEQAIAGDRDKAIGDARQLRSDYDKKLAEGDAAFLAWAKTLPDLPKPSKKPKQTP
jgi:hypothetical protein